MAASDILLLDGGIGHRLKAKGVERLCRDLAFDELFVAGALANDQMPQVVQEVHQEYIDAGADVLTTNSFGCTEWALGKVGRPELAASLAGEAGKLAREAADRCHTRRVLVAGSLPPQQESYQTSGLAGLELLQPLYQRTADALAPHVDLLLCETLSSIEEGLAAASVAAASSKPWWISWTLEDSERALLRSGEVLQAAVASVRELPGLEAVLVNCCAPQAVAAALPVLRAAAPPNARVGGYANGFATTTTEWLGGGSSSAPALTLPPEEYGAAGIILPEAYAAHAERWVQRGGASVLGGCCGIGPEHIRALRQRFPVDPIAD